jgi:hypothetical protein
MLGGHTKTTETCKLFSVFDSVQRKLIKRMIKLCSEKQPIDYLMYIGDDN